MAPFRSPLTDLIDFGMPGKLLVSATRGCSSFVDSVSRIRIKPKKVTDWLLGSNGYNLWPTTAVGSTTNSWPQQSQPPFRSAFLGQFSLPTYVYGKKSSCTCRGPRISVAYFLAPTYGSETRGFCMHGRNLASDRQGYFVKRPWKNTRTEQIYA